MRRLLTGIALALAVLATAPAGAGTPAPGFADTLDPSRKRVVIDSSDVGLGLGDGNGSADDPVLHGGTLRIRTTDGCGGPCDDAYALPSGGWSYIGPSGADEGYRFRDPSGPIRLVLMRAGRRVRVVGTASSSPLGHELAAPPEPVDAVLSLGTAPRSWCMQFGGLTGFRPDTRFSGRNAPAPASCP